MFTPLVSPAVTPFKTHFPINTQFHVPGAYFSPLKSPALHAQKDALYDIPPEDREDDWLLREADWEPDEYPRTPTPPPNVITCCQCGDLFNILTSEECVVCNHGACDDCRPAT